MKKVTIMCAAALMLVFMTLPAVAEKASVAMGKKLFANPGLGASKMLSVVIPAMKMVEVWRRPVPIPSLFL